MNKLIQSFQCVVIKNKTTSSLIKVIDLINASNPEEEWDVLHSTLPEQVVLNLTPGTPFKWIMSKNEHDELVSEYQFGVFTPVTKKENESAKENARVLSDMFESKEEENWNACSSCKKHLLQGDDLIDTVYPYNHEKKIYNAYCNVSMGGCGRIVYAGNIEDLLSRWNAGAYDENSEGEEYFSKEQLENALKEFDKNKHKNPELFYRLPLIIKM